MLIVHVMSDRSLNIFQITMELGMLLQWCLKSDHQVPQVM